MLPAPSDCAHEPHVLAGPSAPVLAEARSPSGRAGQLAGDTVIESSLAGVEPVGPTVIDTLHVADRHPWSTVCAPDDEPSSVNPADRSVASYELRAVLAALADGYR